MQEGMIVFARLICYFLIAYVSSATLYLLVLAISLLFTKPRRLPEAKKINKFAILIPAHNEEMVITQLCESLLEINYPGERFTVFVVADNCNDKTAEICRKYGFQVFFRTDKANQGKGYALKYGLEQMAIERFDAVFIVDADNIVDSNILYELNKLIDTGSVAIQCNNSVRNRDTTWFTEVLFVSRTIGNVFYHEAKYRLGLSSYLMGNGMCLSKELLTRTHWDAFSIGEDWEYYAGLVNEGVKVDFSIRAKVLHLESANLKQATSQRLRWSKGRFAIMKKIGFKLLMNGIRNKDLYKIDGSLPLIFPNYSLLVNLSIFALVLAWALLPADGTEILAAGIVIGALLGQSALFAAGTIICGRWRRTLMAVMFIPAFLVWKFTIDVLGITGIYRGKRWIRTSRD